MSRPTTSGLSVQLDSAWLELPVRAQQDSGDWAVEAVDRALEERGQVAPASVRHLYVQAYAVLVDRLRERADAPGYQLGAAWALLADADLLPVTVVEAAAHLVEDGRGVDGFVEALVVAPHERFAPPDVQELATGSGPAVRLQQLRLVDDEVHTSVVYVWPGPADDVVVTLTAWYSSPVEAELSRERVDALAASLQVAA